jgi:hypothetical protein
LKKKITILSLLVVISLLLIVSYRSYGRTKANEYVNLLNSLPPNFPVKLDIKEDVHIVKIIKQTPTNLVMLIKWGDNEKAYISIKNWMTKVHDFIEVDAVDKEKSFVIYE